MTMGSINADIHDGLDPDFHGDAVPELFSEPVLAHEAGALQGYTDFQVGLKDLRTRFVALEELHDFQMDLVAKGRVGREDIQMLCEFAPDFLRGRVTLESYTHQPTTVNYKFTIQQLRLRVAQEEQALKSFADAVLQTTAGYVSPDPADTTLQTYRENLEELVAGVGALIQTQGAGFKAALAHPGSGWVRGETPVEILRVPISELIPGLEGVTCPTSPRSVEVLKQYGQMLTNALRRPGIQYILQQTLNQSPVELKDLTLEGLFGVYVDGRLLDYLGRSAEEFQAAFQALLTLREDYVKIDADVAAVETLLNTYATDLLVHLETLSHLTLGIKEWGLINYLLNKLEPVFTVGHEATPA
jgi:hypothetical protein